MAASTSVANSGQFLHPLPNMILPLDTKLVESSVRIGAGTAKEFGNE
jgi:hypothetical protein